MSRPIHRPAHRAVHREVYGGLRRPLSAPSGDLRAQVIAALFGNGEEGGLYDPSDLSTLYQDSAGTTPVTADGDPVGRIEDLSGNGNHLTQATAAARPQYKTDGTLHWLAFDGVDDLLDCVGFSGTASMDYFHGMSVAASSDGCLLGSNLTGAYAGIFSTSTILTSSEGGLYNPTGRKNGAVVDIANRTKLKTQIATASPLALTMQGVKMATSSWPDRFIFNGYTASGVEPEIDTYGFILRAGPGTSTEVELAESWIAEKTGVTL